MLTGGRGYLLDTNVISEARKRHPDPGVTAFLVDTNSAHTFISVMTLGELRKGVAAELIAGWVDRLEQNYSERVIPVDGEIARVWGELSARRSLPVVDTLIAATALVHDLTLVTRNVRDFAATEVNLLDPWRGG